MYRTGIRTQSAHWPRVSTFLVASAVALLGSTRPAVAQGTEAMGASPEAGKEEELPHAFFTHMGLPEGVGVFNLRVLGIATRDAGKTDGDLGFHLETGLTKNIGLHIRNDRVRTNEKSEVMFQYTAVVSKDGMSGFAPIIEFEIPTHAGASRINTLVGFTTSLGSARWVFNQVLHYDPREDMIDASAALVIGASRTVFPVLEILGDGGKGRSPVVNLLGGFKVRLQDWLIGGVAIAFPITGTRDYASQVAFGPDVEWKR